MRRSNFPLVEQVKESPDPTKVPCLPWVASLILEELFQMCEKAECLDVGSARPRPAVVDFWHCCLTLQYIF